MSAEFAKNNASTESDSGEAAGAVSASQIATEFLKERTETPADPAVVKLGDWGDWGTDESESSSVEGAAAMLDTNAMIAAAAGVDEDEDEDDDSEPIEANIRSRVTSSPPTMNLATQIAAEAIISAAVPKKRSTEAPAFAAALANQQKALVRFAVAHYRGDEKLIESSIRALGEAATAIGVVAVPYKSSDALDTMQCYNETSMMHARSALDNTRVIVNSELAPLYKRAAGALIDASSMSGKPYDITASATTIALAVLIGQQVGEFIGTKQRLHMLQQRNSALWAKLDEEGESQSFDADVAASIADAFSLGSLAQLRSGNAATFHIDTHDEERFVGAGANRHKHHYHFVFNTAPSAAGVGKAKSVDAMPAEGVLDLVRSVAGIVETKVKLSVTLKDLLKSRPAIQTKLESSKKADGAPFTLFAPTNDAFNLLSPKILSQLFNPAFETIADEILKRHFHSGTRYREGQIKEGQGVSIRMANGDFTRIRRRGNLVIDDERAVVVEVVHGRNGSVFVIDKVLMPSNLEIDQSGQLAFKVPATGSLPPTLTSVSTPPTTLPKASIMAKQTDGDNDGSGTVADVIAQHHAFTTFTRTLKRTDLDSTLRTKGPFTVFAPTSEAFDRLTQMQLDALFMPGNEQTLSRVLLYHIVPGSFIGGEVAARKTLNSITGEPIVVIVGADGRVRLNGEAVVLESDMVASNGIVHKINHVLLPADLRVVTLIDAPAAAKKQHDDAEFSDEETTPAPVRAAVPPPAAAAKSARKVSDIMAKLYKK